ncbi:MAG: CTP synthase [Proteobacteria bacterium]|nr:CTP synthase [Cystobacterineae bacterium]MCL2314157.1 CTP synthase [Pseudomonadota bacterium]
MRSKKTKFIFVTGGVASSLGKGIVCASIGSLLENRGLSLTLLKMDPYINVDPETMSPFQHGEIYVTHDGGQGDLDLGHYERFTRVQISRGNNFTSGKIYDTVIQKERRGEYHGQTVQVIPHITDETKLHIWAAAEDYDIAVVEIGGTVGDIESLPFLEAIRQLRFDVGPGNSCHVHLTLLPYISAAGEVKTKPTQHSVMKLREIGIQPDVLICRADRLIEEGIRDKLALFCNVEKRSVFVSPEVESVYELPMEFHRQGLDERLTDILNIWAAKARLKEWEVVVDKLKHPSRGQLKLAVVGKYVGLKDSYRSLTEALIHGGIDNGCLIQPVFVDAQEVEQQGVGVLQGYDGVVVPAGFGVGGSEGKIAAAGYARKNKLPYLGIGMGMQMAVVEFARNVAAWVGANSLEFDAKTPHPVVVPFASGQELRLGSFECRLSPQSLAASLYKAEVVKERHRHSHEISQSCFEKLQVLGLEFSGIEVGKGYADICELKDHPFFLGCQFHPEFQSKPFAAHPLISGFVHAAMQHRDERQQQKGRG